MKTNVTEWNVDPESGTGLCKLWDTNGSNLLHIGFDNITEYDPDVLFDKKYDFCSKCCFFMKSTYIQVLIKKTMLKARIKLIFDWK